MEHSTRERGALSTLPTAEKGGTLLLNTRLPSERGFMLNLHGFMQMGQQREALHAHRAQSWTDTATAAITIERYYHIVLGGLVGVLVAGGHELMAAPLAPSRANRWVGLHKQDARFDTGRPSGFGPS